MIFTSFTNNPFYLFFIYNPPPSSFQPLTGLMTENGAFIIIPINPLIDRLHFPCQAWNFFSFGISQQALPNTTQHVPPEKGITIHFIKRICLTLPQCGTTLKKTHKRNDESPKQII